VNEYLSQKYRNMRRDSEPTEKQQQRIRKIDYSFPCKSSCCC